MDSTTTAAIIVLPVAAFLLVFAFLWWCLFPSSDDEKAKENTSYASHEPWIAKTVSREESDAASPSFDLEDPGTATKLQRMEGEQKDSPVRNEASLRSPRWRTGKTRSVKHAKQSSDVDMSEVDEDIARSVDNEELTLDDDYVLKRSSPSRVIRKLFQSTTSNEGKKSVEIPQVFSSGVNITDDASHPDDEITIGELGVDGMDGTLASRDIYTTM